MERGKGERQRPQSVRAGVKGGRRGDCLCRPHGSSQSGSCRSEGLRQKVCPSVLLFPVEPRCSLPKVKAFTDS